MEELAAHLGAQVAASSTVGDEMVLLATAGRPGLMRPHLHRGPARPRPRPSGPCSWRGPGPAPSSIGWTGWAGGHARGQGAVAVGPGRGAGAGVRVNLEAVASNLKLSRALSGRDSRRRALAVAVEDLAHEEYLLQELEEAATYRLSQISAPVFGSDGAVALALTVVGLPEKLTGEEIPLFATPCSVRRGDGVDPGEDPGMNPEAWAAFDLSGRVAVVTGAASGIGRASAVLLGAAGAAVLCAARTSTAPAPKPPQGNSRRPDPGPWPAAST